MESIDNFVVLGILKQNPFRNLRTFKFFRAICTFTTGERNSFILRLGKCR